MHERVVKSKLAEPSCREGKEWEERDGAEGALKERVGAGLGFNRVVRGVRIVWVDFYCCWARGGGGFPREAGEVFGEVSDWLSEVGGSVSST